MECCEFTGSIFVCLHCVLELQTKRIALTRSVELLRAPVPTASDHVVVAHEDDAHVGLERRHLLERQRRYVTPVLERALEDLPATNTIILVE